MQELEKILEEIQKAFEENTEDIMGEDGEHHFVIDGCTAMFLAQDIIHKHINDGWIPVDERLPMRTFDEKINESYQKYLVFIDGVDGWDIDIAVYDFWNDKKWREAHDGYGEIENVIAWRPLPEPYHLERSDNNDGE